MPNPLTLNDLKEAVSGGAAAFRCRIKLQPIGSEGDKVFPPTYAGGVYAVEDRRVDGRLVRCVLLDSVQSQANRMEEALLDVFLPNWRELPADGDTPCDLPLIAVQVPNHGWITSLTAPHRIHDAILRDSYLNGASFRRCEIGKAIVAARLHDATAFYRYCPTVLLFGTWDSTGGGGLESAKVPRAVVSEIIGVDITAGVRTASRIDPLGIRAQSATIYRRTDGGWALKNADGGWVGAQPEDIEKDKDGKEKKFGKGKPSDIVHGNVTPDMPRFDRDEIRKQNLGRLTDVLQSNPLKLHYEVTSRDGRLKSETSLEGETVRIREGAVKPGGVTGAYALHTWTLSLTQLRRLRFPVNGTHDDSRNGAARTVLAGMALYALALQHERGYWLRSRCELIQDTAAKPAVLERLGTDGKTDDFELPCGKTAKQILDRALEEAEKEGAAKIEWEKKVIRLTPMEKLVELVRASDARQPEEEEELAEAVDAGDQS